ncbi:hypothetical protein BX666DRAFT_2055403 [Dichotomocladium elegans]|nr:hypothetical protein BX666DRAFT_2055403 [Dichotomocladium elegans]
MMGYDFAVYVNKYLQQNGHPTRNIAKIDSNPAKSKHLETATTKLFDVEVDFANLRTEVYDPDSRIPASIGFGTPTEDAYRRDITINSLFYNVNSCTVEDFTKQGLSDLENGLIRTPLQPFETFRDDPLRVLRCVRFASRFDFTLVPELVSSVKNEEIQKALNEKISKERIAIEVEKMVTGPLPLKAIQILYDLGLYHIVFAVPRNIVSGTVYDPSMAVRAVGAATWLDQQSMQALRPGGRDESRLIRWACFLLPFADIKTETKNRMAHGVQDVLRDSMKATKMDMVNFSLLFTNYKHIQEMAFKNAESPVSRQDLGMLIRELKELWPGALKVSLIAELLHSSADNPWQSPDQVVTDETTLQICQKYDALMSQAVDYGITECYKWKPMLDGKQIANILSIKPGPRMSDLLLQTMKWQLAHPEGTQDECAAMIKQYWESQKS